MIIYVRHTLTEAPQGPPQQQRYAAVVLALVTMITQTSYLPSQETSTRSSPKYLQSPLANRTQVPSNTPSTHDKTVNSTELLVVLLRMGASSIRPFAPKPKAKRQRNSIHSIRCYWVMMTSFIGICYCLPFWFRYRYTLRGKPRGLWRNGLQDLHQAVYKMAFGERNKNWLLSNKEKKILKIRQTYPLWLMRKNPAAWGNDFPTKARPWNGLDFYECRCSQLLHKLLSCRDMRWGGIHVPSKCQPASILV